MNQIADFETLEGCAEILKRGLAANIYRPAFQAEELLDLVTSITENWDIELDDDLSEEDCMQAFIEHYYSSLQKTQDYLRSYSSQLIESGIL